MPPPNTFLSNLVWQATLFVAIAYIIIAAAVFLLQSRLIYYPNLPSRAVLVTPDQIGLAYEAVTFTTEDGVRLDGWFVPAERARGVLLFFHGNAGNISHRLESLRIFHALGLSTLIFDYRGYGRSEGEASERGTYLDGEAAWRYLTGERGIPAHTIVYFGRSLGAAIAAHLAMTHPPRALILESGFTSAPDMGQRTFPFLPVRWLARFQYDAQQYVRSVSAPVLVVHSPHDEIIPIRLGRALFASANEPKSFLEIRGGHNEGFLTTGKAYVDGLEAFLRAHVDR